MSGGPRNAPRGNAPPERGEERKERGLYGGPSKSKYERYRELHPTSTTNEQLEESERAARALDAEVNPPSWFSWGRDALGSAASGVAYGAKAALGGAKAVAGAALGGAGAAVSSVGAALPQVFDNAAWLAAKARGVELKGEKGDYKIVLRERPSADALQFFSEQLNMIFKNGNSKFVTTFVKGSFVDWPYIEIPDPVFGKKIDIKVQEEGGFASNHLYVIIIPAAIVSEIDKAGTASGSGSLDTIFANLTTVFGSITYGKLPDNFRELADGSGGGASGGAGGGAGHVGGYRRSSRARKSKRRSSRKSRKNRSKKRTSSRRGRN